MRATTLTTLLICGLAAYAVAADEDASTHSYGGYTEADMWVAVYVLEFGGVEDWVCVAAEETATGEYVDPSDAIMDALQARIERDDALNQTARPVSECGRHIDNVYYVDDPDNTALLLIVEDLGASEPDGDVEYVHLYETMYLCGNLCGCGKYMTASVDNGELRIEERRSETDEEGVYVSITWCR